MTATSKPKLARIAAVTPVNVNPLDNVQLKNIGDCNKFAEMLGPKIDLSPAKSPAWLAFMTGLLNHIVPKMDEKVGSPVLLRIISPP